MQFRLRFFLYLLIALAGLVLASIALFPSCSVPERDGHGGPLRAVPPPATGTCILDTIGEQTISELNNRLTPAAWVQGRRPAVPQYVDIDKDLGDPALHPAALPWSPAPGWRGASAYDCAVQVMMQAGGFMGYMCQHPSLQRNLGSEVYGPLRLTAYVGLLGDEGSWSWYHPIVPDKLGRNLLPPADTAQQFQPSLVWDCTAEAWVGGNAYCGDGVVNGVETCDDGRANRDALTCPQAGGSCSYCTTSCREATGQGSTCGDGRINGLETCDDGSDDGVGCAPGCAASNATGGASNGYRCVTQREGSVPNSFCFSPKNMIPLRNCSSLKNDYCVSLTGTAISGGPYEIHFDTGSWETSIPDGCLDMTQVTVLERNVTDVWRHPADKVQGQLALVSEDGKATWAADDFIFYAIQNTACDRNVSFSSGIVGAFPSVKSGGLKQGSLPWVLATNHAAADPGIDAGYGIVSFSEGDIFSGWTGFKSWLQIGPAKGISDDLSRRKDLPDFSGQSQYIPQAVLGFEVTIAPGTLQEVNVSGLSATIDTGAPHLTLRLNRHDPQRHGSLADQTIDCEFSWWKPDCRCMKQGTPVEITFTDSAGNSSSYTFPANGNFYNPSPISSLPPTQTAVCDWLGNDPWPVSLPAKPETRINLGNTIYFYRPVFFYDISNKQVGIKVH